MTLSAGTRLGPYEVVSALGSSGMGEVYRALPAAFAHDGYRSSTEAHDPIDELFVEHEHVAPRLGVELFHATVRFGVQGLDDTNRLPMQLVHFSSEHGHVTARSQNLRLDGTDTVRQRLQHV